MVAEVVKADVLLKQQFGYTQAIFITNTFLMYLFISR